MAHFRNRATPQFFIEPSEVGRLAARLAAEHPEWREASLRARRDWHRFVYSVGETSSSSMAVMPDWNALPLGPGQDTVYLHRAHHLLAAVQLARAQVYGAESLETLRSLIRSWMGATEGRAGSPAYLSSLIAVHRAVALTWTLAFLAGCKQRDPDLEFAVLKIILTDARFVHAKLGTSIANNHLLGDGFLMLYVGILYPEFREAEGWRRDGEAVFLRELRRQTYEDGTSFEHAVHYHELVCEMTTSIALLARRNRIALEPWVEQRLRRMLEFQAALGGREARCASIGDAVEISLLALDEFEGVGAASHREILRALYDPTVPPPNQKAPGQERAAWLLGGQSAESNASAGNAGTVAFPDGGFAVLNDESLGGALVFRTGPARNLACSAGHMHADLLSVYLRAGDIPIIVDAGTFSYRSRRDRWPPDEPAWRAYFLGPAAHNALCISGHDPLGRNPGDFPPGPLKSHVRGMPLTVGRRLAWTEAAVVGAAPYDGYVRGVVHVAGCYWLFYDLLPAAALTEDAWLSLHFSREVALRKQGAHGVLAEAGAAKVLVVTSREVPAAEWVRGARDPLGGWISPKYGELAPAFAYRVRTTGGPVCAATLIEPSSSGIEVPTIDMQVADSGTISFRVACTGQTDYILLSRGQERARANFGEIDLEGLALWLRTDGTRLTEVRGLGVRSASSASLGFRMVSRGCPRDLDLTADPRMQASALAQGIDLEAVRR
jgi:hypothetical protein